MEEEKLPVYAKVGQQIGSDCKIEQGLLSIINYNIPNQHCKDGLLLLQKIITNILKNPTEKKFHSLKKDNEKLHNSLYCICNVPQFLTTLGFLDLDDMYQIWEVSDDIYENLRKASRSLENYIRNFVVLQEGDPKLTALVNEKKKQFEQEKQYKQKLLEQFNTNKDSVMKEHQKGERKQQYDQNTAKLQSGQFTNQNKHPSNNNRQQQ